MPHDWHDPTAAQEWDGQGDAINPTRAEQLDILISVLADFTSPSDWILDLGYGSGKVEDLIFERIPGVQVVGIDNSVAMAALAKERLHGYTDRFVPIHGDLAALSTVDLPVTEFGSVIAIQSLHHLPGPALQSVYRRIHALLRPGGVFLLLDRLQVENAVVFPLLHSVWQRADRQHGSSMALQEGDTFTRHQMAQKEEGDVPVTLETHLAWLRECRFDVATLHVHGNQGLIAAIK